MRIEGLKKDTPWLQSPVHESVPYFSQATEPDRMGSTAHTDLERYYNKIEKCYGNSIESHQCQNSLHYHEYTSDQTVLLNSISNCAKTILRTVSHDRSFRVVIRRFLNGANGNKGSRSKNEKNNLLSRNDANHCHFGVNICNTPRVNNKCHVYLQWVYIKTWKNSPIINKGLAMSMSVLVCIDTAYPGGYISTPLVFWEKHWLLLMPLELPSYFQQMGAVNAFECNFN